MIHLTQFHLCFQLFHTLFPSSDLDLDECLSPDLNDCHSGANCTNVWGTFECRCGPGLRDPWSDQYQRAGRECISCSNAHCNNRGTCHYDDMGTQLVCKCMNNYYGSQCEIDGDILTVAIGASVTALLIITLTIVCLVMWGRRWNQEQKQMIGSPIFDYINRTNADSQMKTMPPKTYQAALEDRMRWAQIADVMAQSNHYAVSKLRRVTCFFGFFRQIDLFNEPLLMMFVVFVID